MSYSLFVESFAAIKNKMHKDYAIDILCSCLRLYHRKTSKELLKEPTRKKSVTITRNDRIGLDFEFTIVKPSGTILIGFHKKRSKHEYIILDSQKATDIDHFSNPELMKCLLRSEFDRCFTEYIYDNKYSNKLKDIVSLVNKVMQLKKCKRRLDMNEEILSLSAEF
jgi:hypothetical protein